jgi:hypothetical protein
MKSPNTSDTSGWEARVDLLQQQLDVLVAKDQIRDVLYRYARGVDRKDEALLKSCYHPDGIDAHWSFIGNGHDFAEEILRPHQMGQIPNFKHFITNILIEVSDDRAFCETSGGQKMMGVEHELLGHARVEVAVPLGSLVEADDGGVDRVGQCGRDRSGWPA